MPAVTCWACGRLMNDKKDFPRGNFSSDFCSECVDKKGRLKPMEEIRRNLIDQKVKTCGLSVEEASELVDNILRQLPTWNRKRFSVF
jgi:hypothetical protein